MFLYKVAIGKAYETTQNMPNLPGKPIAGFHSVFGKASAKGPLNYDETICPGSCHASQSGQRVLVPRRVELGVGGFNGIDHRV